MKTVLRSATATDEEAVIQVFSQAFNREKGGQKYERDLSVFKANPASHHVLEYNGKIISALHISEHRIQIGCCVITKADVGEISTLPEYQGKGFGTKLMEKIVKRISPVTPGRICPVLSPFRLGVPFPRGFVEFPMAGLTSRGTYTVTLMNF